jgi:hypothetical protein
MPRPSKGDRDAILTRPVTKIGDAVRHEAYASGMSISDYVAMVLANHVGLGDLAPHPHPVSDQGVLPVLDARGGGLLRRSA